MSTLFNQASGPASKLGEGLMYGGGVFSVCQWVAQNANWIAAFIGAAVAIAGYVITRRSAKLRDQPAEQKRKEEREEHLVKMAILRKELG